MNEEKPKHCIDHTTAIDVEGEIEFIKDLDKKATLVLAQGEQVSIVAGNKTYRGTLTYDGRWFIKLAAVEPGASDEVLIAKL